MSSLLFCGLFGRWRDGSGVDRNLDLYCSVDGAVSVGGVNHYRSEAKALLLRPLTYSGQLTSSVGRGVRTTSATTNTMLWSQGIALVLVAMVIRGGF